MRNVDTGVHHIHRHRNMRLFFRLLKVIDNRPCISILADHPLGECAMILRVQLVEPFQDKLGMTLVLSKDNGFSQPVATGHFNPPLHQILQHNVHGRFIKHKFVECRRRNKLRHYVVLDKIVLIPLLVLIGQIIVGDALFKKLRLDLIIIIRHHHMLLIHGRFIIIGVGRNTVFHLKKSRRCYGQHRFSAWR